MRTSPLKLLASISLGLALLATGERAAAQLSIGPGGLNEQSFDSVPPVASWSYRSIAGGAGDITTKPVMDAQVQTNDAALINTALLSAVGNPPAASAAAMYASDVRFLVTRPTGNRFNLLMATLRNDTGSNISAIRVQYNLTFGVAATEQLTGHSVYYSLTGATGTWQIATALNGAPAVGTLKQATLNLSNVVPSGLIYLLFSDDNGSPGPDEAVQLDDFAVLAVPSAPGITNHPQSTSVSPGGSVTFTVGANGATPFFYFWRKGGVPIAGATNQSFTINGAVVGDAGTYSVIVSNVFGTATSSNAVLSVVCDTPASIATQPVGQSLNSGATLSLSVGAVGTSPFTYQWFRNSAPIANATNAAYNKISVQPSDSGLYHVVVNNCIGTPATSVSVVVSVADAPFAIVGLTNHFWKYEATGTDLGAAWREVGYNDSAWATGRGLLAFENLAAINALTNTVLSLSNNITAAQLPTYYFRTTFVFTNDAALITLSSSNYFDDGAVVYLNGTEVFRFNMPAGVVGYNTLAPAANPLGEGVFIISNVPTALLVLGTNVLAVEVHQNSLASSDIVFGMELRVAFPAPTLLAITNQPQSLTVVETKPATFSVGIQGQPAYFQWYKDGVAVPGGTFNPLTIAVATTNDAGFYYVVATNFVNSVTSAVVALAVLPDTNGPTLVDADGTLSTTNVVVAFSELISLTTATNLNHYRITNTLGGPLLGILRATLQNGTNVILHTAARTPSQNYILIVGGIRDVSPRQNLIQTNSMIPISQLVTSVPLVGGDWRYYFDLFNPAAPAGNWQGVIYDDSLDAGWGNGGAGLAYFGADESEFIPFPIQTALSWGVRTYYFRQSFNFTASPGGTKLLLRYGVDDGVVFYLNGTEINRFNMPSGPVADNTFASSRVTFAAMSPSVEIPTAGLLRAGTNVLVAEVHIEAGEDAEFLDVVFGAELTAKVQSFVVGPVIVTGGPDDIMAVEGQSATFRVIQVGGSTFQWQRYGTNLVGATNDTYTIPYVTTNINLSTYRVTVGNGSGSVLTTNATLRILTDTNAPTVLSAFARTNNTIVLTFNEVMGAASAQTAGNYAVTNGSGVILPVTSAVLANGTNVTLSFGSTLAGRYTVVINNVTDAASVPNVIAPNTAVTVGADYFLAMTGAWKYLQVNTNATVQTTFMQTALDDSTWSGPSNALLYVEDAALPGVKNTLLTLLDGGGNRINTYYFRQKFVAPVIGAATTLTLSHIIDDGMILHLNGVEVYRFNMPAGTPTAATQAAANTGNAVLVGPVTVIITNLVGGTNVFAVEVHQQGAASGDVVMGVELSLSAASVVIPSPQTVQLTCQPQSRTNLVGTTASFSVCAAGSAPIFYQWRKGGVNIANATNNILLLNSVQLGDAATYSVFVSNSLSSVLSSNAVLTVTNGPGSCVFVSWTNSLRLTNSVTITHPTPTSSTIILSWANPVTNSCGSNATVVLQRALTLGTANPVSGAVWTNIFTNVFGQARLTNSVTNSSQVFYRLRVP